MHIVNLWGNPEAKSAEQAHQALFQCNLPHSTSFTALLCDFVATI